jgi:hypothetical protein
VVTDDTTRKPLVWLSGEVKSPPFTAEARQDAEFPSITGGSCIAPIPTRCSILDVYCKKPRKVPDEVIERSQRRLKEYDAAVKAADIK